ncbi:uncharacterized protein LOC113276994 [Papaver somniferum]|uniref:uncharacterized protein LOC113276994 n=1 Tax=Papaver somniferum TaxID=3469 RepID=UPI000E705BD5|nr:uncharacterized protein LOC113276994 [Papaver somniferum]
MQMDPCHASFSYLKNDRKNQIIDLISCGFQCPMCDRHDKLEKCSNILLPNKQSLENCSDHHLDILLSLFPELLYDDSSEEAQAACMRVIPRILMHTPQDFLKTKHKFTKETDMASLLSMLPGVFALALLQDNKGQQDYSSIHHLLRNKLKTNKNRLEQPESAGPMGQNISLRSDKPVLPQTAV